MEIRDVGWCGCAPITRFKSRCVPGKANRRSSRLTQAEWEKTDEHSNAEANWLHVNRAFGRDCDHRRVDRSLASGRAIRSRSCAAGAMRQQPDADWLVTQKLRELARDAAAGRCKCYRPD